MFLLNKLGKLLMNSSACVQALPAVQLAQLDKS